MKQYKYVHLLWQGGAHFNKIVVALINDAENGFAPKDHLFVTPYQHIYDEIKDFKNIIFEQNVRPQSAELVNKYAAYGDWVILHGMCSPIEAIKIKNKKKIIWRTWGHDSGGLPYKKGQWLKNAVKYVLNRLWRRAVHSFQLVGVANRVDELSITHRFGKVKTMPINYPQKNNLQLLDAIKNEPKADQKPLTVLVGHSGIDTDNHFEVIDRLKRFCAEDVRFVFVLSYGDEKYIERVKAYIREHCANCSHLLLEQLAYEEYARVLNEADIAILDGKASYALSNVAMLLYFEKKLFLNRDGILAQAFRADGLPFFCTDELDSMTFEQLSAKVDYSQSSRSTLYPTSYEESVRRWKTLLSFLDDQRNKK